MTAYRLLAGVRAREKSRKVLGVERLVCGSL